MSLTVVVGKPGTGKSYWVVEQLVDDLLPAYHREDEKSGGKWSRQVWTNLDLNFDKIDEHMNVAQKTEGVKYSRFIRIIPSYQCGEFWRYVPKDALIIVDEIHLYFPADALKEASKAFVDYLSMHRHEGHDVMMLTQHQENASMQVMRIAERIFLLDNAKFLRIPFFGLELSDVFTVMRAFGYRQEVFVVNHGRVRGRSVKWDSGVETKHIRPELFPLYNSHVAMSGVGGATSDRPEFQFNRREALRWFFRKYFWKIGWRVAGVFAVVVVCGFLMRFFPQFLAKSGGLLMGAGARATGKQAPSTAAETSPPLSSTSTGVSVESLPVPPPPPPPPKPSASGVFSNGCICRDGSRVFVGEYWDTWRLVEVSVDKGATVWSNGDDMLLSVVR